MSKPTTRYGKDRLGSRRLNHKKKSSLWELHSGAGQKFPRKHSCKRYRGETEAESGIPKRIGKGGHTKRTRKFPGHCRRRLRFAKAGKAPQKRQWSEAGSGVDRERARENPNASRS